MDRLEVWINDIENSGVTPTISINGDFNLPFMKQWDEDTITELLDSCTARSVNGKTISSDRKQALRLSELMNNHFLHQFINSSTRINNTLDLFFANDEDFVIDQKNLVNVLLSDHNLLIIDTSTDLMKVKEKDKLIFISLKFPIMIFNQLLKKNGKL